MKEIYLFKYITPIFKRRLKCLDSWTGIDGGRVCPRKWMKRYTGCALKIATDMIEVPETIAKNINL